MFSILMSVYHRENPVAFAAALQSIQSQTLAPSEIVLVRDGPLNSALDAVIEKYSEMLPLKIVTLSKNIGLAGALNAGLLETREPWIMRFDTDDICLPNRIAIQAQRVEQDNVDLFGAQIVEFDNDPSRGHRSRHVPCTHEEILSFGRRRNPFNHMTVCYRREAVISVGGYPNIHLMEDYALWMTMIARGARLANCPEVLVSARVGNGMALRRGGLAYVRSEILLQEHMCKLGMKSYLAGLIDGIIRSAIFVSPLCLRNLVYSSVLRKQI